MKMWSAIDEDGTKNKHDAFRYIKVSNGHQLEIAIVRHQCFNPTKHQMMRNCIILTVVFSHKYEIISSKFRLETIVLKQQYTFEEFDNLADTLIGHENRDFFTALIQQGENICSSKLEVSATDIITSCMALFTKFAKQIYKIDCKNYGYMHAPKKKEYRLELGQRIKRKQKTKSNKRKPTHKKLLPAMLEGVFLNYSTCT